MKENELRGGEDQGQHRRGGHEMFTVSSITGEAEQHNFWIRSKISSTILAVCFL